MAPLSGLRALELATGGAGPGAGMYLADFGVDVLKVELPEGDPARSEPPLLNGAGRTFLAYNRGKRSTVIDYRTPGGMAAVERLAAGIDVLILTPDAESAGLSFDRLHAKNPELVYAVISPYGAAGPYTTLPAYDPFVQSVTGITSSSRRLDGMPVPVGYRLSEAAAGMLLAHGIMMALLARHRNGRGQRVETSMYQAALAMQSMQLVWPEKDPDAPSDPFQPTAACYKGSDGRYLNVSTLQERQFRKLLQVLDLEHLLEIPKYADRYQRSDLHPIFEAVYETKQRDEWLSLLEQAGVPCAPVRARSELFDDPQIVANGLVAMAEHPKGGRVQVLGSPFALSGTPARPGTTIPALGGPPSDIETPVAVTATRAAPDSRPARPNDAGPLAGLKVLDLAIMYAGPGTINFLGDMGADVIKVEAPTLDDSRRLQSTPYLGVNSRSFMCLNRNKRGIVLDLSTVQGQEVLHQLVRSADVLLHNYRAGVPERLGVDYSTLSALNPRLIYAWVTGFGSKGPYRQKPAYDNVIQGYSGIYDARARRDGEPTGGGTFAADTSMPMALSFAIGAALWARERTGSGQMIECSLLGLALAIQAGEWVAIEGEPGDDSPDLQERTCPVVRCGDDTFLTVALYRDAEWRGCCMALGLDVSENDPRFTDVGSRAAHRPAIDALLSPVFATRPRGHWLAVLPAAGVPCAPVIARNELPGDPHVRASNVLTCVEHPLAGPVHMFTPPVTLSHTPATVRFPAPTPGQHTDEILAAAGYDQEQIASLRSAGVVA